MLSKALQSPSSRCSAVHCKFVQGIFCVLAYSVHTITDTDRALEQQSDRPS